MNVVIYVVNGMGYKLYFLENVLMQLCALLKS